MGERRLNQPTEAGGSILASSRCLVTPSREAVKRDRVSRKIVRYERGHKPFRDVQDAMYMLSI